jgi:uncharacterized RDD family membrane protein YckC
MHRTLIFILTVILFYLVTSFSGGHVGVTSQCVNNNCLVSGSTSLVSILMGIICMLLVIKAPRKERLIDDRLAGFWRRFGAVLIDFIIILTVVSPILALPAIIVEYSYTGAFTWSFERDFTRTTDLMVILPSVFLSLAALAYYFYKYTLMAKPTLGQYILGYTIIGHEQDIDNAVARKRTGYIMLAMCLWPIAIVHGLIKKRVFWWDSRSNTRAVLTSSISNSASENIISEK